MAWFSNHYYCDRCGRVWIDEWSCMCDDDCPHCGARHMSPSASDDLTFVVVTRDRNYVVLRSPESAEHDPDYIDVAEFATNERAAELLALLTAGRRGEIRPNSPASD